VLAHWDVVAEICDVHQAAEELFVVLAGVWARVEPLDYWDGVA
jgi:hypothetical protein